MDEPLCILWPDNDCLFLQDIRRNDLGHAAARPHLLALRSTSFSGRVWECHADDLITSASRFSSSPLPWRFQHQRGYSSSVTWCSGLTERARERVEIKQPASRRFLSSKLTFLFCPQAAVTQGAISNLWLVFDGQLTQWLSVFENRIFRYKLPQRSYLHTTGGETITLICLWASVPVAVWTKASKSLSRHLAKATHQRGSGVPVHVWNPLTHRSVYTQYWLKFCPHCMFFFKLVLKENLSGCLTVKTVLGFCLQV